MRGNRSPLPVCSADEALDEIDRILHQVFLLAELTARDSSVDRQSLQNGLKRLQNKIDRITGKIGDIQGIAEQIVCGA